MENEEISVDLDKKINEYFSNQTVDLSKDDKKSTTSNIINVSWEQFPANDCFKNFRGTTTVTRIN